MNAGLILPIKGSDLIPGGKYEPPRVGQPGGLPMPESPAVNYVFGDGNGTRFTSSVTTIESIEPNSVTFKIVKTWDATGFFSFTGFALTIPAGWEYGGLFIDGFIGGTGQKKLISYINSEVYIINNNETQVFLTFIIRLVKT